MGSTGRLISFHSARERIHRADEHRSAFRDAWRRTQEDGSYRVTVDVQDDGTGAVSVELVRPLPVLLSLELGEMLYQLRAALDACVYEAAIRGGAALSAADEQALEFPICTTAAQWKQSARKVRPLTDKQRRIIENVQPYNVEKRAGTAPILRSLGILNDWARKDRHRRLHVMRAMTTRVARPFLPGGVRAPLAWQKVEPLHSLEDDPVVVRFGVRDWIPGTKVHADPRIILEIAVDEPPPRQPDQDSFDERIAAMFFAVKWVVEEFERSLSSTRS